ncbi:agmatinase [Desulforhopalus singaporensis]|uniref:Agmatinase n=1 Tax=Desulforhopalus singaporensis TaxID=91360 RepID=A0A1H0SPB0_9BACT|nr:agmatinase [Desulforhopalus singaporensis]SDP43601.1 agmatinase [Desulforhopalus singaporensis]
MEKNFYQPLSANVAPKFGAPTTFMRLPQREDASGLDACFYGLPMDWGTSARSGTRLGPRQVRAESTQIRPYNMGTGAGPFSSLSIADIGDAPLNPYNLLKSVEAIEEFVTKKIIDFNCIPLAIGGDHTVLLPILRAVAKKSGPVCLIHVDAHADTNDVMQGETIAHGTPVRRAFEECLIIPDHSIQIGLRGSGYSAEDFDWGKQKGIRVVEAEKCWHKSLTPLMSEVRQLVGNRPTYLSFDIDALDPAYAPGTGTLEVGGLNPIQALEIIRGCQGINLVGCDCVEVSPPYDPYGRTATLAANLLFEMLCVLPGANYKGSAV